MSTITAKSFDRFLRDTIKSATSVRERFQQMLAFGFEAAVAERSDLGYLTRTLLGAREAKGIDAMRMQRYICASLPVLWRDAKTDVGKPTETSRPSSFVKNKSPNAGTWEIADKGKWWEFETVKAQKVAKPLDLNKSLGRVIDTLADAVNSASEIAVDTVKLRQQLAAIQELLTKAETRKTAETLRAAEELLRIHSPKQRPTKPVVPVAVEEA